MTERHTLPGARGEFNAALRRHRIAADYLEALRPVVPPDQEQMKREASVRAAESDLHYAEAKCISELNRQLSRHERFCGFGTYSQGALPEHRWWLDPGYSPTDPCTDCFKKPPQTSPEPPQATISPPTGPGHQESAVRG